MGDTLSGRVAIVTGGGQGIGAAEAAALAREGAAVAVIDRNDSASDTAAAITDSGGAAFGVSCDVTLSDNVRDAIRQTIDAFGRIDILVNNAGILRDSLLHKMEEADWDDVIAVNLRGHFLMTRAVLPTMQQQRFGRIINTSSESGLGASGTSNYAASKEAVIGFTRSIAREVKRFGVTVNAIRPRASTPLARSVADQMRRLTDRIEAGSSDPGPATFDVAARRKLTDHPDLMSPDVVAALVVLLASDAGADVTCGDFIIGGDEISVLPPYPVPTLRLQRGDGISWDLDSLRSVLGELIVAGAEPELPPTVSVSASRVHN